MTNEEAVKILRRIQEPEAWEPQINGAAFEALDMAIEALSRQQASGSKDIISRAQAIDALRTCYDTETISMDNGDEYINYGDAVGEIEQLPPIQPKLLQPWEVFVAQAVLPQPKMGKWIYHIDDLFPAESTMECNQCHAEQPLTCDDEFCPHCGAKMEVTE